MLTQLLGIGGELPSSFPLQWTKFAVEWKMELMKKSKLISIFQKPNMVIPAKQINARRCTVRDQAFANLPSRVCNRRRAIIPITQSRRSGLIIIVGASKEDNSLWSDLYFGSAHFGWLTLERFFLEWHTSKQQSLDGSQLIGTLWSDLPQNCALRSDSLDIGSQYFG